MDLLKALRRTTYLSAMAVLALGATEACATTDNVSFLATANCSVVGTLGITEVQQLNFGNLSVTAGSGVATDSVTLTPAGGRTLNQGTHLSLLYGASNGGIADGVSPGSNLATGGEVPGIYSITNNGPANVYVSFATATGQLMDTNHGTLGSTSAIGTFSVPLTLPANVGLNAAATPAFAVDSFTFTGGETLGSAYTAGTAPETPDGTTYQGNYIACTGGCIVHVGATLHTNTAAANLYPPGRYSGTYQIMVSY